MIAPGARLIDLGNPASAHPLNRGLVGWWLPLANNYGGNKLFDITGRGNTGTLTTTGVSWAPGPPEGNLRSLSFDGAIGGVNNTTITSPAIDAAWTYTATVMTTTTGGTREILFVFSGVGNANQVELRNGTLRLGQWGGGPVVDSGVTPDVNRWYRIAVTNDGTTRRIYLDGVEKANSTSPALQTGALQTVAIGTSQGAENWSGNIASIAIHDRCLSASEVAALYDQSRRGHPDTLRRYARVFPSAVSVAGVQFDAASNSGYQAAASTYSWSHTCTGNNRFLAVDVALLSAGQTVTGITYNGVALAQIGARSTVTSFGRVECWGLANPASGANTIVVTLSGAVASSSEAVSYTGVDQTTPTEAFNSNQATNGGAADATVDVTTVTDQAWVHAALAASDTAVTANQTSRNNVSGIGGGSGADEDFGPQSPGVKTMSYTDVGALAKWAIAGYGVRPVQTAVPYTPRDVEHTPQFQAVMAM